RCGDLAVLGNRSSAGSGTSRHDGYVVGCQIRASLPPRLRRPILPMIVMTVAAGLAGRVGQSEQHVQFLKAYGLGQVESRHLGMHIITVSQTDETPPGSK